MVVIHSLSIFETPDTPRKMLNIPAPIMIVTIKAVSRTDSFVAAMKVVNVSRRLTKAMTNAPKAPIAPASVGVKIPNHKPPMTRVERSSILQIPLNEANLSLQLKDGPGGPNEGFSLHWIYIVIKNTPDKNIPGIMPATNNLAIDVSARNPYIIRGMLGGIMMLKVPPAEIQPVDNRRS